MEAVAKLNNCPMSARKMRMVVDLVRGREVGDALNILRFNKREGARWLEKVLVSAVANWEYGNPDSASADDHQLVIKRAFVNEGTTMKRFRPAPHGRAHRIRKRSNHVTLVVENQIPLQSDKIGSSEEE